MSYYTLATLWFWPLYCLVCCGVEHLTSHSTVVPSSATVAKGRKYKTNLDSSEENELLIVQLMKNCLATLFVSSVMDIIRNWIIVDLAKVDTNTSNTFDLKILCKIPLQILVSILVAEFYFYTVHRLFHIYWYQHHKKHHSYTLPRAWSTLYCDITEMVWLNQTTVMLGPFLLDLVGHPFSFPVLLLWTSILTGSIILDHSGIRKDQSGIRKDNDIRKNRKDRKDGWCFIWWLNTIIDRSIMHDAHHYHQDKNFGVLGLCDYVLGTNYTRNDKSCNDNSCHIYD